MFESAEIHHRVDQSTFDTMVPELREALLEAQFELQRQARFSVLILINGIEGAGKGETVKLLCEWMDPRLIRVESFYEQTEEELARPPEWRYWRRMPPKGKIGIYFGNWYSQMLNARVQKRITTPMLDQAINTAMRNERMFYDEGTLIFKFWFHLSEKQVKARLKELRKDPLRKWQISPFELSQAKVHRKFLHHGEHVLRLTSRDYAPWYVVEGVDANYRSLMVARILLDGLQAALKAEPPARNPHIAPLVPDLDHRGLLASLDLNRTLDGSYKNELAVQQARLAKLMNDQRMRRHSLVAVFEGNDAAGKGGAIRRVTQALDPRCYRVIQVAAPTDEERAQAYLWRFWRHIPARGHLTIFDRSWYGRVLVERVEGFCSKLDWMRAYGEICDFENSLTSHGVVLVKFWLAIDKETQHERFKAREQIPYKRFKITEEDWRNREKWDEYVAAVEEMVSRTSTDQNPWTLVEANDKRFARIKVLRTINNALEAAFAKHK